MCLGGRGRTSGDLDLLRLRLHQGSRTPGIAGQEVLPGHGDDFVQRKATEASELLEEGGGAFQWSDVMDGSGLLMNPGLRRSQAHLL